LLNKTVLSILKGENGVCFLIKTAFTFNSHMISPVYHYYDHTVDRKIYSCLVQTLHKKDYVCLCIKRNRLKQEAVSSVFDWTSNQPQIHQLKRKMLYDEDITFIVFSHLFSFIYHIKYIAVLFNKIIIIVYGKYIATNMHIIINNSN